MRAAYLHVGATVTLLVAIAMSNIFVPDVETIGWDGAISLAWDPRPEVAEYRLYYRVVGGDEWLLYDTVPPGGPLRVSDIRLEPGEYEFAVAWATADGRESIYHESTSGDAIRPGGERGGWVADIQ